MSYTPYGLARPSSASSAAALSSRVASTEPATAQLRDLKLGGMASAVEEQLCSNASMTLSFEERLALMVDREVHHRGDKRRAALLKKAGLKYPQACIEDVDGRAGRGFERSALMSLALSRWVEDGTAILVVGLCVGAVRVPARALGVVSAYDAFGRGSAHPARQWRLRPLARGGGPHRRPRPGRLGDGRAGRSHPFGSDGDHR
jgi:hypothetical protein